MKKLILILFLTVNLAFAGQLKIVTTVKPLADIAREIVREKGKVSYIIPPNVSVHIYEYKINDIKKVYQSDLFIFIGVGEPDINNLQKNAKKEKINVSEIKNLHKIKEFEFGEKHEHHFHEEGVIHPALWLDPYNGKVIAESIYKKVSKLDPDNERYYRENLVNFEKRLDNFYKKSKDKISQLKNRYFISYHYAWPYFVKAFNLIYLDVIELGHGREPTPKHIAELIKKIKKFSVKSIFAAKQFYNKRYGELIKRMTGVKVVFLDPFGEKKDYIQMLDYNVKKVFKALKENR